MQDAYYLPFNLSREESQAARASSSQVRSDIENLLNTSSSQMVAHWNRSHCSKIEWKLCRSNFTLVEKLSGKHAGSIKNHAKDHDYLMIRVGLNNLNYLVFK